MFSNEHSQVVVYSASIDKEYLYRHTPQSTPYYASVDQKHLHRHTQYISLLELAALESPYTNINSPNARSLLPAC